MNAPDAAAVIALMDRLGAAARAAAGALAAASTASKNAALVALASSIRAEAAALQAENARDLEAAQATGLAAPLVDRLRLSDAVIAQMAAGCEQVAALPDPIGEMSQLRRRPSGITVGQMR